MTRHCASHYLLPALALAALAVCCKGGWSGTLGNEGLSVSVVEEPALGHMCPALLERYTGIPGQAHKAEKTFPEALREQYTMHGAIPLEEYFVDDSNGGKGHHYSFSRPYMGKFVDSATKALANIPAYRGRPTDVFFLQALSRHAVAGQHVAVFGSTEPWHEALAIAAGASHVTTIEYNKIIYDHEKVTTVQPEKLVVPEGGFDVAFSLSSFDHDGLGRYGDPLSPSADLVIMRTLRCMVKKGGLLFLTVPIGPDVVVYNLHRRYGRKRLPALLAGWEIVDVVGWDERRLDLAASWRQTYEPVFVLRNSTPLGDEESAAEEASVRQGPTENGNHVSHSEL